MPLNADVQIRLNKHRTRDSGDGGGAAAAAAAVTYPPAGHLLISHQLISAAPRQGGHLPHLALPHRPSPHRVAETDKDAHTKHTYFPTTGSCHSVRRVLSKQPSGQKLFFVQPLP